MFETRIVLQIAPVACWDVYALQLGIVPARLGFDLQFPIPVPQMESAFPRDISTGAHDWGQVLMFEG